MAILCSCRRISDRAVRDLVGEWCARNGAGGALKRAVAFVYRRGAAQAPPPGKRGFCEGCVCGMERAVGDLLPDSCE